MTTKNAGAFEIQPDGKVKEISFPIPLSMIRADIEGILMGDLSISQLAKEDHEKACMIVFQRVMDDLPFGLTDDQESRLLDFVIENV